MSLTLLLEKYDVSTEEGLQKALHEIEKEELEVDEALSGVLSRAVILEGHLRTTSQAYSKLGAVKADAQAAADMVETTATLARDVSAKVRQLDLARSRVAECQRRVHDLIDLQVCSAGVEAAIKAHDYETGAMHVSRFLSMEPGSVAASPEPRRAITAAAETLREQLVKKFEEAARKNDEASVERLFKLFPQIGHADEGVKLLAKYLATQLESQLRRVSVSDAGGGGGGSCETAVFADAFTRVMEAAAAAAARARSLAPTRLALALTVLQPHVCAGARRVWRQMCTSRGLPPPRRAVSVPRRPAPSPSPSPSPSSGPSPSRRDPDLLAAELALVCSRIHLYFTFLRRNAEADAAGLETTARSAAVEAVEKIINECDLMMTSQDVLANYLDVEREYLETSVEKALRLATPQPGSTSSTLVDDVFFIARKVIRRSTSSGSADGVCCVLNEVAALLERQVAPSLRRVLRSPPPDPLADLTGVGQGEGGRHHRDLDAQRALYLSHMCSAAQGATWAERLAVETAAAWSGTARTKVASCAEGLGAAAGALRAARDLGEAGLRAALRPKLLMWADQLADPHYDLEEMEDDAEVVPAALEALAQRARASLGEGQGQGEGEGEGEGGAESLLAALVGDLAAFTEEAVLKNNYLREGGMAVERRVRRLASWAGGAGAGGRERAARLVRVATLLALEEPAVALAGPAAELGPRAALILARRSDFKMEDIKRLKL